MVSTSADLLYLGGFVAWLEYRLVIVFSKEEDLIWHFNQFRLAA